MKKEVIGINKTAFPTVLNPITSAILFSNRKNKHVNKNKNSVKKTNDVWTISFASLLFLGINTANSNLPVAIMAKILLVVKKMA